MPERSKSRLNEQDRKHAREEENPRRARPAEEPEVPGGRKEAKGHGDAVNKTTRRGCR